MTHSEAGRPIPLVVLPANRRGTLFDKLDPEIHANRRGVLDELEKLGFAVEFLDVNTWPKNPFAGRHSLLAAIDPWRALTILFARRKTKIVLSYFESGALLIALLRRLLFFRAKIVIVDIGIDETWRLRRLILRLVIPRVDAILAFGKIQASYIEKNYRTKALVRFLPQKVDTDFYRPAETAQEDYVLSVGDDISRDYDTLLQAMSGMDAQLIAKTRLIRDDPAGSPRVTVISKRLSDLELRSLYQRARIVVLPLHSTLHAGGISTLLEAMAVGKPIIVSNSIGLRDYIRHEENCLAVECGDASTLRTAIKRLLNDPAECARLGRSARQYVERESSHAVHAQRLSATLTEVISPDCRPQLAGNSV
jgi:glycosyltransferase involved in cell wall biosynthesis